MHAIETIREGDLLVRFYYDEDAESPRKWDNLGTMVCWHRRYDLGDRQPTECEKTALEFGGWKGLKKHLARQYGATHVIPLGLLDHSGLYMYAGGGPHWSDTAGWDSGTVGFIYDSAEGRKKIGTPPGEIEHVLEAEVREYDQYLQGEVYGFVVTRKHDPECDDDDCRHDEHVDSCWGFLGDLEYCRETALAAAGIKEEVA